MSVLLTVDEVAKELNVGTHLAQRIVGRGFLSSVEVGSGQRRITPDALRSYANSGCPNLIPEWGSLPGWPENKNDDYAADAMFNEVSKQLAAQGPSPVNLQKSFQEGASYSEQITKAGRISEFFRSNLLASKSSNSSQLDRWGRSTIRFCVQNEMKHDKTARSKDPWAALFHSPSEFQRLFQLGLKAAGNRNFLGRRDYQVEVPSPNGSAVERKNVFMTYTLSQAELINLRTAGYWMDLCF